MRRQAMPGLCAMNYHTVSVPHYRKQARKMRKLAVDETQDVRDELLRLAEDYDHIASSAAERATHATRQNRGH
jgi:uncharacterized metal-binding protein YceD (DUF177 family)